VVAALSISLLSRLVRDSEEETEGGYHGKERRGKKREEE
jgi:hypothetical protein